MLPFAIFMACFFGTFFLAMGAVWKWADEDTPRCIAFSALSAITGMIAAYVLVAS